MDDNRNQQQDVLKKNEYLFRLSGNKLNLLVGDTTYLSLPLIPDSADCATLQNDWKFQSKENAVEFKSDFGTIALDTKNGDMCYRLQLSQMLLSKLNLFTGSDVLLRQWHTFVFNGHDRLWDSSENVSVEVKSCNIPKGEISATWFPNVAPHVVALQMPDGKWLAVSVPGPLPVAVTSFNYHNGSFSITFDHLRCGCEDSPAVSVYLVPGLASPEQALEEHARLTAQLGYFRQKSEHPKWWSWPAWGLYDEYACRRNAAYEPPDATKGGLTTAMIEEWVGRVEEMTGVKEFLVSFDQGYFRWYGDYTPIDSLGGAKGLRDMIDRFRVNGKRVGLYMHQYFADRNLKIIQQHPDWLLKGSDLEAVRTSHDMEPVYLDWTRPDVREYIRDRIRFIVSDEKDCLNADWLCVNNNQVPDARTSQFHNPNWAIGDLMAYKVMRFISDAAKQAKPDCQVHFIGTESFLQPVADRIWINESWGETCDNWFQMARIISRLLPGTILSTCPYLLSHPKFADFVTITPAYGAPAMMPLSKTHTGGHVPDWEEMTPEDHRRWKASWQVYNNAPMTADQVRKVDFDGNAVFAYRKYTKGRLAGFYAAKNVGRRALVTYSQNEARVMATDYCIAEIPLPPGVKVKAVEKILHSGEAVAEKSTEIKKVDGQYLRMELQDSGCGLTGRPDAMFYRMCYE